MKHITRMTARRASMWVLLYHAQDGKCVLCGRPMPSADEHGASIWEASRSTFEHLKPRSQEGGEGIFNKALTHWSCNQDRRTDPLTKEQETAVFYAQTRLRETLAEMGLTEATATTQESSRAQDDS